MTLTSEPAKAIDPHVLRADFPILQTTVHGKPLVYLDSAATSQKPRVVIDAVDTFYREYNANVHRGIYEIGERSTAAYETARAQVAKFIGASDAHEVVFTRNATEAINLVSYSWGRRNIGRGDAIVLTEMEHHANLVPWQLLVQEKDGDLEFIPITDDGLLRLDVFEVLLKLKPKLVAFTHVSNTLGTINPVEELTRMTGVRPVGYRAPSWNFSPQTLGYLCDLNFLYDSSLMGDDVPYLLSTEKGELVELPVSWATDDWPPYVHSIDLDYMFQILPPERAMEVFMAEFEAACAARKIPLYVLPPRSPKLNGAVERCNGAWRYGVLRRCRFAQQNRQNRRARRCLPAPLQSCFITPICLCR